MLTQVAFENFRSFKDATLVLQPLTVVIGANASGKSNAVEGLRLLSWIAQGNRLDSNPFTTNGSRSLRGGPNQLPYRGETHFSFVCKTTHPLWDTYTITLASLDDTLRIDGEELGSSRSEPPLFETGPWEERTGKELRTWIKADRPAKQPLEASFTDQVAVLVQSRNLPRLDGAPGNVSEVRAVAAQYQAWLSALVFLDAHPAAMRGSSRKSATQLASDGSNLSGVLYNLCRDARMKAEILDLVSILPEQAIHDIGFLETPRDEVMVQLTGTFGSVELEDRRDPALRRNAPGAGRRCRRAFGARGRAGRRGGTGCGRASQPRPCAPEQIDRRCRATEGPHPHDKPRPRPP